MPQRWNVHHMHLQPAGGGGPAVAPGDSYEFTDDEAEHLGPEWVDKDPRRGLSVERAFKAKRDKAPDNSPAESGDKESEQPE